MIPKISKYAFYHYSDFRKIENQDNLLQLIAHSTDYHDAPQLSSEEVKTISARKEFCGLVFEEEWGARDGILPFLMDFSDESAVIQHYSTLIRLANELGFQAQTPMMSQTLAFYQQHRKAIHKLADNESQWGYERKVRRLEEKIVHDNSELISLLAQQISSHPGDFCRDENGEEIAPKFTGNLKDFRPEGTLQYDYSVENGLISGELSEFDKNGTLREVSLRDGYFTLKTLKKWYSNGQIKFEQINDTDVRYWYKNGQLELENINGKTRKWTKSGEEIHD